MDVTRTKRLTPLAAAASMSLMFPAPSATGSPGVPPIVDTTASRSSISSKTRRTSSSFVASPLVTIAIISSISARRSSVLWSIQTQAPMSLSMRVTRMPTPPPPATRMLELSGSREAVTRTAPRERGRRRVPAKRSHDAPTRDALRANPSHRAPGLAMRFIILASPGYSLIRSPPLASAPLPPIPRSKIGLPLLFIFPA